MTRSKSPAPSIAEKLGELNMAWGALELSLSIVLGELMRTDPTTATIVGTALDYRHKRDLINSLAAAKLKNTPAQKRLSEFMSNLKGMNTERNENVHCAWAYDENGLPMRMVMRNQGAWTYEKKRTSARHLATIVSKVSALANESIVLSSEVRLAVQAWHEKLPPLDWPLHANFVAYPSEPTSHKQKDPPSPSQD